MPTDVEAQLSSCIGKTVAEVVEALGLTGTKPLWIDEPPTILRGVLYADGREREVTLYFAETEPLYRKFSVRRDWDATLVPKCRVGGIQYERGETHYDIGPAVPGQWRRPNAD